MNIPWDIVGDSVVAGLLASLACGFGVAPLLLRRLDPTRHIGVGYGFAGGLMVSASVYNLIYPGLTGGQADMRFAPVLGVTFGILAGALLIWAVDRWLRGKDFESGSWSGFGGRASILIFLAMSVHSIPEGVAVGVGYASQAMYDNELGLYIALAIGIHNVPEGLAVAIPLRAAGARLPWCFLAAFLTSLPQPIAAIPASIASWLFRPIMPIMMGFAAGAMIFLVLLELIPDALSRTTAAVNAWAFTLGFCLMLLIQVLL